MKFIMLRLISPNSDYASVCVPVSVVNQITSYTVWRQRGPMLYSLSGISYQQTIPFPEHNYNFSPSTGDIRNEVNDKEGLIAGQIRINCEGQS